MDTGQGIFMRGQETVHDEFREPSNSGQVHVHALLRLLPAGAVAGWDTLRNAALALRTPNSDIHDFVTFIVNDQQFVL